MADEHLVILIQQGDINAMGELYLRYFPLVKSKCLSFTKNNEQAQDQAQDVMLKVMEKISSFKGESKFSTWLYAITFNYCSDQIRRANAYYSVSLDTNYNLFEQAENDLEDEVNFELMEISAKRALAEVPQNDQHLLIMKYQYNKSIKELQDMYKLSASAIKMRLLRAREKATHLYTRKMLDHAA